MDDSDRLLLDRYLTRRDEEAFRALVGRHLDFVHGVARRVTGNDELARDVAQLTFIRLAERAALVPPQVPLATWLHRVSRCLAVDLVRAESRRKKRETESTTTHLSMDPSPPPDWTELAPVIDDLIHRLPAADRDVLLLRYYRNESHAAVAAQLGLTESIVRQRAYRAIEKLRLLLGKQGITTSSAALAVILPAHAAPAAPAFLSTSVLQAIHGISPIAPNFITQLLLAVTTSQKAALAGSLLLLFAATGYTLSPDPSALDSGNSVISAASDSPDWRTGDRDLSRERRTRPVPATAEERMERLKEILAIPNRVELQTELIEYLDQLPRDLFEETAIVLKDLRTIIRDIPTDLAISAWAKVDRNAALEFAADPSNRIEERIARAILTDWCADDSQAALAWAVQSGDPETFISNVVWGVARSKPEDVGKLVRDLPDGPSKWTAFEKLAEMLKDEGDDPELLKKVLAGASESQQAVILGNLSAALTYQPEQAIEILKQHPEAIPFATPGFVYYMWGCGDPAAALASMEKLAPGEIKNEAIPSVIHATANADATKAIELMNQYSAALTDFDRWVILKTIGDENPTLALNQLPQITAEETRDKAVVEVLKPWLLSHPAEANAWLEANPQSPAVLKTLRR